MTITYFPETDTLDIERGGAPIGETRNPDDDTLPRCPLGPPAEGRTQAHCPPARLPTAPPPAP